jgi:cysteine desulfuration protein SufE
MMKLDESLAEFAGADPEEALEMLMEFGTHLPPLTPGRAAEGLPATCLVRECQTAVYLWVDVVDGHLQLEASVTEKSPTVRGLVALLVDGLTGATPAEVLSMPDNLLPQLGLQETLGMTRQRGLAGVIGRIKRVAREGSASATG